MDASISLPWNALVLVVVWEYLNQRKFVHQRPNDSRAGREGGKKATRYKNTGIYKLKGTGDIDQELVRGSIEL